LNIAEPNYVTPTSQTTAIIEAAKTGRHNILKRLIELKVDVSFRNGKQRSPLFYASRNGDGNSVGALTKAGAQRDDGSLHEAARKVHANVVSLLLNDQHDPDYASENHKGRSALAELCVNATAGGRDWESQAYDIVKLLLPRTDLSEKYDGKMILHLALDNVRSALEMTTVLLRFSQIWKHLSDDDFLYEDDSNLCYSPTTYVEYFYEGSASGMRTQLIDLLKTKRCKDRYFSSKGKHPDRPLGLPADMASIFRRESLADQSHAETLRRCRETAMLELELSTMRHQQQFKLSTVQHRQQLEFSNEQHQTTLTQAGETEAQRLKSQQISHRMSLAQKRELEQEDRHALGERNRLLLQHNTATAAQEREIMSTRNANQISHEQRLLLMQQSHLDAQYSTKKKLLDAQDHVDEKHHSRNLRLMDRQDQSVAARARLAISVADANRLAAIAGSNHASLLRLTNGSDAGSVD
jgi:hypothetical protein